MLKDIKMRMRLRMIKGTKAPEPHVLPCEISSKKTSTGKMMTTRMMMTNISPMGVAILRRDLFPLGTHLEHWLLAITPR
jgi:hypothetical protein